MSLEPAFVHGGRRSKVPARLKQWRGLSGEDALVWERFLQTYDTSRMKVEYNVRLGSPAQNIIEDNPALAEMWTELRQKRVDAVVEWEEEIWIVELKPRGSLSALGQALAYKLLYEEQEKPTKPVEPVVICAWLDDDLRRVMGELGVNVFEVGT